MLFYFCSCLAQCIDEEFVPRCAFQNAIFLDLAKLAGPAQGQHHSWQCHTPQLAQ